MLRHILKWHHRVDRLINLLPFLSRHRSNVPFAMRNVLSNKRQLLRSATAVAFAISLIFLQLGFRAAFLDSATDVIRKIDGDIFLTSSTKFRFDLKDSFSRRQLHAARGFDGVESVRPIYAEYLTAKWKNPQDKKLYLVRVLAFDPDQPVFLIPEITDKLARLKQQDTAMFDRRSRRVNGFVQDGMIAELARREVQVVGTFPMGPNFTTDGTLIVSDRNFLKLFSNHRLGERELADVEFGVVKVRPGVDIRSVQQALRTALPANISVRTKSELIDLELAFQNDASPAGPIFAVGTTLGFIFGMLILYQILYSEISEQLPQYATLKAIGYDNAYLVRVVLEQANVYAVISFLPAVLVCAFLFQILGEITLLPLRMSIGVVVLTALLTIGMSVASGLLAVYRATTADPAEVF
jgi:putative ABC transport system permease protein